MTTTATATNVGTIVQVIGPVLDVEFAPENLPEIYNALRVDDTSGAMPLKLVAEVQQHIGQNVVRVVAMSSTDGRSPRCASGRKTSPSWRTSLPCEPPRTTESLTSRFPKRRSSCFGKPSGGGNVRELENTIERAVILSRGETIEAEDIWLPLDREETPPPRRPTVDASTDQLPLNDFIEEMTRRHILSTLERTDWRKQEAADALHVDRATLYRMIKRYALEG